MKCSICNKLYENKIPRFVIYKVFNEKSFPNNGECIFLCPSCTKELTKWMNELKGRLKE